MHARVPAATVGCSGAPASMVVVGNSNNWELCEIAPNSDAAIVGVCDSDLDDDGLCDEGDNCPDAFNPDQGDADGDGVGNACDLDDEPIDDDDDDDEVVLCDAPGDTIAAARLRPSVLALFGALFGVCVLVRLRG